MTTDLREVLHERLDGFAPPPETSASYVGGDGAPAATAASTRSASAAGASWSR